MIRFDNLSVGYSAGAPLRKELCGELRRGELTCLLGLNGTGKSTLLRTLCGFLTPLSGEIYLDGSPLREMPLHQLSTLVGVVLTEKGNSGGLRVRELVSLGRQPHTGFFGKLSADDLHIVEESMKAAGIAHKADSFINSLSDGERQRAFIAKALSQECPVVILDEPTAFLDVLGRREIMELLANLAHNQKKAILVSSHDVDLVVQKADTLWIMDGSSGMVAGAPAKMSKFITDLLYHDL